MHRIGNVNLTGAVLIAVVAATGLADEAGPAGARTVALSLSAEEAIPAIGIGQGNLTTLSFVDREGTPLPIVDLESSSDDVAIGVPASHPHVATLRRSGKRESDFGLVALLEGIDMPVHLAVNSKAPPATRVVVRIGRDGASDRATVGTESGPAGDSPPVDMDAVIREYLLAHPEVIREALDPARQLASKAEALRDEIVRADGVPAAGDPAGAVTVVEFFDYRCGYCKRSADAVRVAIAAAGVRVELRDYPILGPDSERASRLALAAGLQGRYEDAHFALLEREEGFGPGAAADLAAELGLDAARLEADMESAQVTEQIEANRALARRLGVTGTPAFLVLGPEAVRVAPGAVDGDRIAEMIEAVN